MRWIDQVHRSLCLFVLVRFAWVWWRIVAALDCMSRAMQAQQAPGPMVSVAQPVALADQHVVGGRDCQNEACMHLADVFGTSS